MLDFAGSEALGANVHLAIVSVHLDGDSSDIRVPDPVGPSM